MRQVVVEAAADGPLELRPTGRVHDKLTYGAPLVGQASSRGAQLFGSARVLPPDHPEHERYWHAVRWQADHVERSRPLAEPPVETITVVQADRIVYTERWLRREGYAPRQFWHADANPRSNAPKVE